MWRKLIKNGRKKIGRSVKSACGWRSISSRKSVPNDGGQLTNLRYICMYARQTWIWLIVESWVDKESKAFCLSHELIWIKNGEALWVMSQSESIPGESAWVMSWFWVNSVKTSWVMSWIDSSLRNTAWVTSWFQSVFQIFWVMSQFESKLWFFESWVDLNQNILEAFWVMSRFE